MNQKRAEGRRKTNSGAATQHMTREHHTDAEKLKTMWS